MHVEQSSITDEALVQEVVGGDRSAFAQLVQRHTTRFYAVAYRLLQNKEEAEDIVQEAFLKLWNKPELWNASKGAKFTTWFYRLAYNLCIDHIRKKRSVSIEDEALIESHDDTAEQYIEKDEQKTILAACIDELPERQRVALNLCFYEEASNKEAAEIMGVSLKALQSLVMRAKTSLKEKMQLHTRKNNA